MRNKAAFKTIELLSRAGLIRLLVPEVVRLEFESQQQQAVEESVESALKKMRTLQRTIAGSKHKEELRNLELELRRVMAEAEAEIEADFDEWLADADGELIPFQESDLRELMRLYAAGQAPFKSRRSRDDLPDGLIFLATRRIGAESGTQTVLVSGDDNLRRAAESPNRIAVYENLDGFLRSDAAQGLIAEHVPTINFHRLLDVLRSNPSPVVTPLSSDLESQLPYKEVSSYRIPDDNHEGHVNTVYAPDSVGLDLDEARDYGEGRIVIPFRASVGAEVGFYVYKADYWGMTDRESSGISVSDWNDHYFEAEKYFELQVDGLAAVSLDEGRLSVAGIDEAGLLELLEEAEVAIESLTEVSVAEF